MPAIQNILFPYDFSKQGRFAARYVKELALQLQAKVTLFSAIPPVWTAPPAGVAALAVKGSQELQDALKTRLDTAFVDEFAGLTVERITTCGDPGFKISEFADANAVDLVMMPTHGTGMFRSLLIGSSTAKVLHDAKCPVWTAAHAEEQRARSLPKTILCAVDSSPSTPSLIQWAADYSKRLGASLRLLHVVTPVSDWLSLASERHLQEEAREAARVKLEELQKASGVEAQLRIAVGPISDTVTEEARQEGADLIVIGRGSLPSELGRLRTHAYAIIQQSPCPVISV